MIVNKKILITGGSGFLGSHVVELLEENNEIFIPRSSQYNLTKEQDVNKLFSDVGEVDIVVHIAADIGGIGYSSAHPAKQLYNNLLLNSFMLHYSWLNNVKKFVGIGSVCEYPAYTSIPFNEDDIWNGYPVETNDAYGLSKRMLLAQTIAYKKEYNFNSIHLLPVNLYGPRDNFDVNNSHVIPALIRKMVASKLNNEPIVEIWGTGKESREFLYVEDAARAIVMATEKYNDIKPINLGVGKEITISELANLLKTLIGFNGEFVYLDNGLGGQQRRTLDINNAKDKFGFVANTPFSEGLKRTIEYYYTNFF